MIISRTPFRVSFFGGGTDYPLWYENNHGAVISATINKYAYITLRELPPFFDYKYRIQYYKREEATNLDAIEHPVVREVAKELGVANGLEMYHNADLPARSGLGSSSTFTVGFYHAIFALKNKLVTKRELAMRAINMEQNVIGEAVGSQDQTAAAFGGLNYIEFNKSNTFQVSPLFLSKDRLSDLQNNLLLCFTGFQRTAETIAKTQIKETPTRHKELTEMMLLLNEAKSCLTNPSESLTKFGELLGEQWKLKRGLTNVVSNSLIDDIYRRGINAGAIGGKLLGAGGGGFILFFAQPEYHERIKSALSDKLFVPFRFENTGSQIIYYSHD